MDEDKYEFRDFLFFIVGAIVILAFVMFRPSYDKKAIIKNAEIIAYVNVQKVSPIELSADETYNQVVEIAPISFIKGKLDPGVYKIRTMACPKAEVCLGKALTLLYYSNGHLYANRNWSGFFPIRKNKVLWYADDGYGYKEKPYVDVVNEIQNTN